MLDFENRVRHLSPQKRALLVERLKPLLTASAAPEHSRSKTGTRLVGYVVPQSNRDISATQLRDFLGKTLPEYMIPGTFVVVDSLPRMPNGKIDRQSLPDPVSVNADSTTEFIAPRNSIEQDIAAIWADMLGLETISIYDNFFEIGGDSILSIQIVARARQKGIHFTPAQVFQYQTVAELASIVSTHTAEVTNSTPIPARAPLTPIQHWFFEHDFADAHHWNQALLLETPFDVNVYYLEQAAQILLSHHDALRLAFKHTEHGWEQYQSDTVAELRIERVELGHLNHVEQLRALEVAATAAQSSLDPMSGNVVNLVWFRLGENQSTRLLIVIHHLVVDTVSWQILLEDLETTYNHLQHGKKAALPQKTTSYLEWAQRLSAFARQPEQIKDSEFWLSQSIPHVAPIPVDQYTAGANTEDSTAIVTQQFSVEDTRILLTELPVTYNMQIHEALLTALGRAFWRWTARPALLVGLETHGRQDIVPDVDLSRTVGWFTGFFPLLLQTNGDPNPDADLKGTKERFRAPPLKGLSYGLLRYASDNQDLRRDLESRPQPDVLFNYLGQLDQMLGRFSLFKLAAESAGTSHSPRAQRHHLLEISALIRDEKLQVQWMYSRNIHDAKTVEYLVQLFDEAVREVSLWCHSGAAGGYTPSDFPEAALSQSELDDLLAELDD